MLEHQLSVFLANKPGVLAEVCNSLANENINIRGLSISDTVDHAVVRLVVDEPLKALHLLGERGTLVVETDVVSVQLPNEPGALGATLAKLAREAINIEYAYGSSNGEGVVFLRVSDPDKAQAILKS